MRRAFLAVAFAALILAALASCGGDDAANSTTSPSGTPSDSGTSLNVITSPDNVAWSGGTSLALDGSGNPVVSYYDANEGDLMILHCGDAACGSGNVITSPDSEGDVGRDSSLALDGNGNPVVSYVDGSNSSLKILHCGDPNCADGNVITSPDTSGNVGADTSLVLDSVGNPVVGYVSFNFGPDQDLKVLHCGDPNCSGGNVITSPDTSGDVGMFTSLALDSAGNPVVGYLGNTSLSLKVLHCGDPNCADGNVITSPDTSGDVGADTSLVLDTAGNPVVSYRDFTSLVDGDLKVLHCGDPDCATGNVISSPDTAGDVGRFTSLVLDEDGNPIVSYWDASNGDLKVLHCGDPDCATGNVISSPDTAGDVGRFTSLVLDEDGNPIVSYWDRDSGDLKILHCGDPTCSSESADAD